MEVTPFTLEVEVVPDSGATLEPAKRIRAFEVTTDSPVNVRQNIMIGRWPRIPGECWWEVLFIDDRRHANAIRDIDAGNAW